MSKQPVRASVRSVNSPEAVLRAALTALSCCREEQVSLDEYLDSHLHDPQLRRRLSNLLFNCCRHRRQVQKAIDACCRKKPEKRLYDLLTAALTMAAFQNSLVPESVVNIAVTLAKKEFSASAGRFVNAVLRKALTLIELNSAELLPPMIEKRWKERFEPEVFKFLTDLFITPAPGTVRLRSDFEVTGELADELVPLELETPWRFFQCNDLGNLLKSPLFKQGAFYIQDPAPAKVYALLEKFLDLLPAEGSFIDLCAAPGGKLIMGMELLKKHGKNYRFTALDRSERRLKQLKENLQRCDLACRVCAGDAGTFKSDGGGLFELVTCDVPCSNSGVFRRRPDALWRWNSKELPDTVQLQSSILTNAALLTAPGGLILYSTCSLEPEENSLLINNFLKRNQQFELLCGQLFMPDEFCDGTFAALMRRKSATPNF